MSRDIRTPINDTPISGIDQQTDNLINERFRSVINAILHLQQRTLVEPRSYPPGRAYDGQVELADGVNWDPLGLGGHYLCYWWQGQWYPLLDDRHMSLTPPLYLDDPHKQYWHVIRDAGWSHMYFENFATPKVVAVGQPITAWTGEYLTPWQLVSDTAAGTVTVTESADFSAHGAYQMSVSGFIDGGNNQDTILTMYVDGVASTVRMPALTRGTVTTASVAWSGVIHLNSDGVLDLRPETGSGISIYNMNWSLHRISPEGGSTGANILTSGGIPPGQPVPPNWGGNP